MANEILSTPAPDDMPRVSAGKPTAENLASGGAGATAGGLAGGKNAAASAKIPFGGNVGKKVRADGLKPGSPEALAADRAADAERKRRERAEKRAVSPPPALPSAPAPTLAEIQNPVAAQNNPVADLPRDEVLLWTVDDFRQCAPELVELAEAWRIDSRTKQAVAGNLPRVVVEEIKKDAAFPPGSKKSLSTSSPVTLAKMFNALKVPLAMKTVISAAPALAYIVVRDLQMGSRIEKLIAENARMNSNADAK